MDMSSEEHAERQLEREVLDSLEEQHREYQAMIDNLLKQLLEVQP